MADCISSTPMSPSVFLSPEFEIQVGVLISRKRSSLQTFFPSIRMPRKSQTQKVSTSNAFQFASIFSDQTPKSQLKIFLRFSSHVRDLQSSPGVNIWHQPRGQYMTCQIARTFTIYSWICWTKNAHFLAELNTQKISNIFAFFLRDPPKIGSLMTPALKEEWEQGLLSIHILNTRKCWIVLTGWCWGWFWKDVSPGSYSHKPSQTKTTVHRPVRARQSFIFFSAASHCLALWTRVALQVWTCVKYVPKQSIA